MDAVLNNGTALPTAINLLGKEKVKSIPKQVEAILTKGKDVTVQISGVAKALSILRNLFIIAILYSAFWIFFDIKYGDARKTIVKLLVVVIAVNVVSYQAFTYAWKRALDKIEKAAEQGAAAKP